MGPQFGKLIMPDDIIYSIDIYQIFKKEHEKYSFLTQGEDRVDKRYNQFVRLFSDQLRAEVINSRHHKVKSICRSYLELLYQLNVAGWKFLNLEHQNLNK